MDKFKIDLSSCVEGDKLKIHQEMMGQIQTQVIDFKEQATRDALISLGWTPPEQARWLPISEAKKPQKDRVRIYSYKPVKQRISTLSRVYAADRTYGLRECDYFTDLPTPPEENEE
jgi:hypothetical protein